jgi:hypothetical protein
VLILDISDVVETHIPFVTGPMKSVSVPTGDIVALENEHSFGGVRG